jgi:hypothetical protein
MDAESELRDLEHQRVQKFKEVGREGAGEVIDN